MRNKLLMGTLGAMLVLTPFANSQDQKPSPTKNVQAKRSGMSEDMRQAIEWERAKDRAAARQAAIEARRGNSGQSADRVIEDKETGRKVKDTKAPGSPKRKE